MTETKRAPTSIPVKPSPWFPIPTVARRSRSTHRRYVARLGTGGQRLPSGMSLWCDMGQKQTSDLTQE